MTMMCKASPQWSKTDMKHEWEINCDFQPLRHWVFLFLQPSLLLPNGLKLHPHFTGKKTEAKFKSLALSHAAGKWRCQRQRLGNLPPGPLLWFLNCLSGWDAVILETRNVWKVHKPQWILGGVVSSYPLIVWGFSFLTLMSTGSSGRFASITSSGGDTGGCIKKDRELSPPQSSLRKFNSFGINLTFWEPNSSSPSRLPLHSSPPTPSLWEPQPFLLLPVWAGDQVLWGENFQGQRAELWAEVLEMSFHFFTQPASLSLPGPGFASGTRVFPKEVTE